MVALPYTVCVQGAGYRCASMQVGQSGKKELLKDKNTTVWGCARDTHTHTHWRAVGWMQSYLPSTAFEW